MVKKKNKTKKAKILGFEDDKLYMQGIWMFKNRIIWQFGLQKLDYVYMSKQYRNQDFNLKWTKLRDKLGSKI